MERLFGRYDVIFELTKKSPLIAVANDVELNVTCCLKLLSTDCPDQQINQIKNQMVAAIDIAHPNIAQVFYYDVKEGIPYIVSQYVGGPDFLSVLKICGNLSEVTVRRVLKQLGKALCAIHDAGLTHLDIKPANVVLDCHWSPEEHRQFLSEFKEGKTSRLKTKIEQSLNNPEIKLIDLGISAPSGIDQKRYCGTLIYSSPEQLRQEQLDGQSDIYSVGVTVCKMLTGKLPNLNPNEVKSVAREDLIRKMRSWKPLPIKGISDSMNKIIMQMLQPDKRRRYQSMKDVIHDLEEETLHYDDPAEPASDKDRKGKAVEKNSPAFKREVLTTDTVSDFFPVPLLNLLFISVSASVLFLLSVPVLAASIILGAGIYFFSFSSRYYSQEAKINWLYGMVIFTIVGAITGKLTELITVDLTDAALVISLLTTSVALWALSVTFKLDEEEL